jgi:VIT1/CCC1 family predicted Fe2+/Mn2+ transporter
MFSGGAIVPIVPFLFASGVAATVASIALTGVALLTVGALTARLTGRSTVLSAARMFAIGMAAAAVTYGIGVLIGVAVIG